MTKGTGDIDTGRRDTFTEPDHVLVLEDLDASAKWLAAIVERAFPSVRVTTAASLAQAREAVLRSPPDIALVDLELPDGSGVDLIHQLAHSLPECRCIVTTIYSDDRHLFPALRAGAAGYLLKDQPEERVVAALRSISAGEPPLSPMIAQRLLRVFGAGLQSNDDTQLTPRERETLVLIAKGLPLQEVALQLNVTRNTAAGYVKLIYRKLKVSSRAEAALEAARLGLVNNNL